MTEELTLTDFVVEGSISPELDGRYVRIGPNPVAADPRSYRFFAGDGMLHGVRLWEAICPTFMLPTAKQPAS